MTTHNIDGLPPDVLSRLAPFLGCSKLVSAQPPDVGYGGAKHWLIRLNDGRSCFVKVAVDARTAAGLRTEYEVYSRTDLSFHARLLWWDEDGEQPVLVLEDLSDAFWPPPWEHGAVDKVLQLLDAVHATSMPHLRSLSRDDPGWLGWQLVAAEPKRFLSLGVCSAAWLSRCLPTLLSAAAAVRWEPTHLVHNDTRSDNICFLAGEPLLIDWDLAGLGSPLIDLTGWLPSLETEGGPAPEEVLREAVPGLDVSGWAALYSGYYARHARLPEPGQEPTRNFHLLKTSLSWAARALDLPPIDRRSLGL